MKPIESSERLVRNIQEAEFQPFVWDGRQNEGQQVLQLDNEVASGTGFHIFKMEPGATTTPHEHTSGEHFYVIEGDLVDHDGYEYKSGDIVFLKRGTIHNSTTRNGCTLVVYLSESESSI